MCRREYVVRQPDDAKGIPLVCTEICVISLKIFISAVRETEMIVCWRSRLSRGAVPRGYARAQAKAQVEPPDEGGRHGGRPAGAQAEETQGAVACEHLISQFRRLGCRDRGGSRVCRQASRVGLRDAIEIVSARLERHAA
jgi:hypothetical protein